jgi:ADP-ribosylglycohydrolase
LNSSVYRARVALIIVFPFADCQLWDTFGGGKITIRDAAHTPPADYVHLQGWVIVAFQNALWQLLNAPSLEEGVVDTVMRGGDTDTNAAIAGALLGAVYGRHAVPKQWVDELLSCRPKAGDLRVRHPRPECFWPIDSPELAKSLVAGNRGG